MPLRTHLASSVSTRMNTFHFFSSAIVDLPVVHESFSALAARLGANRSARSGIVHDPREGCAVGRHSPL